MKDINSQYQSSKVLEQPSSWNNGNKKAFKILCLWWSVISLRNGDDDYAQKVILQFFLIMPDLRPQNTRVILG